MKKVVFGILVVLLLGALPGVMAQDDAGQVVNFRGKVKSVEDGLIQVSLFTIDPSNAVLGIVPEVGVSVEVDGVMQDGVVMATDIYPAGGDPAQATTFQGKVKSVEDGTITVSVFTVVTGAVVLTDALEEGMKVQIVGGMADGMVYASSIDIQGTCEFTITEASASLREAPGTGAAVVGYAVAADVFTVTEVHIAGGWGLVAEDTWVALSVGELAGVCGSLPVSDVAFVAPAGE